MDFSLREAKILKDAGARIDENAERRFLERHYLKKIRFYFLIWRDLQIGYLNLANDTPLRLN